MSLLWRFVLRNNRFFTNYTHSQKHFRLCKRETCFASRKNFKTVGLRSSASRSFLFCGNGRSNIFHPHIKHISVPSPGTEQWVLQFHTSGHKRALPPPLIWIMLKPLQKLAAILLGRSIRKWWAAQPHNHRQLMRDWVLKRRWHLTAGAGVAMVIVVLLLLTHLDESPLTGRVRLLVFSREKYLELASLASEAHMEEFAEHLLPVDDPRHQMVEQLVDILAQSNKDIPEVSKVPWSVHVVDSPNINAFVLPNGKVFMFTGMLNAMSDLNQLVIVLGHEMAHAVLDHSAEQASLSHVVDLLSLLLVTAIWAVCPADSLAVLGHWAKDRITELMFSRPYSRKLETEADEVGLQLAAKACADVRWGPVFWQQMELAERLTGEPALPEWLSTHPSHRNRTNQLNRLIPQALELRESCVCPALSATDPRVVFSKTVQIMLEKTKNQAEGASETISVPTGSSSPLLASTVVSSSPKVNPLT